MTDRVNTLTVVLESTMHVDDVEHLANCIAMFKGVLDVKLGEVVGPAVYGARVQERARLTALIQGALDAGREP